MNHEIFKDDSSKGLGDNFERKVTFELKEEDLIKIEKELTASERIDRDIKKEDESK